MFIFIFTKDQELWTCELMGYIMGCDHSLGQKDILKFVYCFMILFLIVYILKHFFIISTMYSLRECNNVVILFLIIFCLNWNRQHKYKIFCNSVASRVVIN
jgi:uncharacterized membrane protein